LLFCFTVSDTAKAATILERIFKNGVLSNAYPFSAALILVGFDMKAYNGASSAPNLLLAASGMASMILMTVVLLFISRGHKESRPRKRKKSGIKNRPTSAKQF